MTPRNDVVASAAAALSIGSARPPLCSATSFSLTARECRARICAADAASSSSSKSAPKSAPSPSPSPPLTPSMPKYSSISRSNSMVRCSACSVACTSCGPDVSSISSTWVRVSRPIDMQSSCGTLHLGGNTRHMASLDLRLRLIHAYRRSMFSSVSLLMSSSKQLL